MSGQVGGLGQGPLTQAELPLVWEGTSSSRTWRWAGRPRPSPIAQASPMPWTPSSLAGGEVQGPVASSSQARAPRCSTASEGFQAPPDLRLSRRRSSPGWSRA